MAISLQKGLEPLLRERLLAITYTEQALMDEE